MARFAVSRTEHERQQSFVHAAFEKYRGDPRVRLVDFTDALCDQTSCPPGPLAEPFYIDEHH
jgi:hypothetical protein